eukprot:1650078-Alexandrium_andersonii.AAC.1
MPRWKANSFAKVSMVSIYRQREPAQNGARHGLVADHTAPAAPAAAARCCPRVCAAGPTTPLSPCRAVSMLWA